MGWLRLLPINTLVVHRYMVSKLPSQLGGVHSFPLVALVKIFYLIFLWQIIHFSLNFFSSDFSI